MAKRLKRKDSTKRSNQKYEDLERRISLLERDIHWIGLGALMILAAFVAWLLSNMP
jgi:hypothetical protein